MACERRAAVCRGLVVTGFGYLLGPVLSGSRIPFLRVSQSSDAMRFAFPSGFALTPGNFVLVAEDPSALAARYQTVDSPWYHPEFAVVGPWSGSLNNAGKTVAVVAAGGEILARTTGPEEWIELVNTGDQPVDLTGCTLTDTLDRPARLAFPANTELSLVQRWEFAPPIVSPSAPSISRHPRSQCSGRGPACWPPMARPSSCCNPALRNRTARCRSTASTM